MVRKKKTRSSYWWLLHSRSYVNADLFVPLFKLPIDFQSYTGYNADLFVPLLRLLIDCWTLGKARKQNLMADWIADWRWQSLVWCRCLNIFFLPLLKKLVSYFRSTLLVLTTTWLWKKTANGLPVSVSFFLSLQSVESKRANHQCTVQFKSTHMIPSASFFDLKWFPQMLVCLHTDAYFSCQFLST